MARSWTGAASAAVARAVRERRVDAIMVKQEFRGVRGWGWMVLAWMSG